MKTIEITSGNQKAQFTTKSMTFNGREFLYSNMTDVVNNTELHTYTFRYDGIPKAFPYEEKDAKILNAIFSQVQGMQARKAEAASGVPEQAKPQEVPEESAKAPKKTEEAKAVKTAEKAEIAGKNASEKQEMTATAEAKQSTGAQDSESKKDAEKSDSETKKSEKKPSVKGIFAKKEKTEKTDSPVEGIDADPQRHARLKKSFTIFGIILAAVIVASLIYYAVFGTSSDRNSTNPNASESQQYNDIDELINDLQ